MSAVPENPAHISIDDDVGLLTEQIQAVKELGGKDEVDDGEIYDVSIRWGTALAGRLPRLVHYSSLGLLSEADEHRFRSLCDQLRAVSDLVAKFGLARPRLPDPPGKASEGNPSRAR